MMRAFVLLFLLVLAATLTWAFTPRADAPLAAPAAGSQPMSQPVSRPASQPASQPGAAPVRATAPVHATHAVPATPALALPDGSFVPLLNGVREAPRGSWWPAGQPWSPIVRRETYADGTEWYVHADGTKSTTVMVWRSELGRHDAAVQVATPVPTLPLAPAQR